MEKASKALKKTHYKSVLGYEIYQKLEKILLEVAQGNSVYKTIRDNGVRFNDYYCWLKRFPALKRKHADAMKEGHPELTYLSKKRKKRVPKLGLEKKAASRLTKLVTVDVPRLDLAYWRMLCILSFGLGAIIMGIIMHTPFITLP